MFEKSNPTVRAFKDGEIEMLDCLGNDFSKELPWGVVIPKLLS